MSWISVDVTFFFLDVASRLFSTPLESETTTSVFGEQPVCLSLIVQTPHKSDQYLRQLLVNPTNLYALLRAALSHNVFDSSVHLPEKKTDAPYFVIIRPQPDLVIEPRKEGLKYISVPPRNTPTPVYK